MSAIHSDVDRSARGSDSPGLSGLPMFLLAIVVLGVAGFSATSFAATTSGTGYEPPMANGAEFVGAETCLACHEDAESSLAGSAHSSSAFHSLADGGCEACHGPGSLHLEDPEAPENQPRISDWTAGDQTGLCLSCHADAQSRFHSSPHSTAGLTCTDCHAVHRNEDVVQRDLGFFAGARITGSSAKCAECHEDVASSFAHTERHRLQEGILDCVSCHDPHAPSPRIRLGAFKDDTCADCHADKAGPFVFEHGASRVEGCTACHSPHGSPNRHMLSHQNVAETCYSCHGAVPGFHARFTLDTNCAECHSSIHGSNLHPAFLK